MDILTELAAWLGDLEPAFAFLLALPFAVAAAGLAAEAYARGVAATQSSAERREARPRIPRHARPARRSAVVRRPVREAARCGRAASSPWAGSA